MSGVCQLGPCIIELRLGVFQLLQSLIFPVPVFLLALQVLLFTLLQLFPPVGNLLFPLGKHLLIIIQLGLSRCDLRLSSGKLLFHQSLALVQLQNSHLNLAPGIFQLILRFVQLRDLLIQLGFSRLGFLQLRGMGLPAGNHLIQSSLELGNGFLAGTELLGILESRLGCLNPRILRGNHRFQLNDSHADLRVFGGKLHQGSIHLLQVVIDRLKVFQQGFAGVRYLFVSGNPAVRQGFSGISQGSPAVTNRNLGFGYLSFAVLQLPLGMAK